MGPMYEALSHTALTHVMKTWTLYDYAEVEMANIDGAAVSLVEKDGGVVLTIDWTFHIAMLELEKELKQIMGARKSHNTPFEISCGTNVELAR